MTHPLYDVIVVGSGAAGSFAAKELTAQGLRTLVLEAGRPISAKDFDPAKKSPVSDINIWERAGATLKGQPVQARAAFFANRMAHFFVNDRQNPYTTPKDAPFLWIRGRQTGGRLHSFGRVLLRWTDDDFRTATRTGQGKDWPISYADLAPYYTEVEETLGLYGRTEGIETFPDGSYSHQALYSPPEEAFKETVEARFPGRRVTTWRYIAPERMPRQLQAAMDTGLLTIVNNAVVDRVITDPASGHATGVEYIDAETRQRSTVQAKAVVLCASPIESVRLMLNSASERHPQGLGNSSGALGRYFMDQLPCLAVGDMPSATGTFLDTAAPHDEFYNPSGGIFIPRFDHGTSPRGDYCFQGSIGRYGAADQPARLSFFGFGMMQPSPDNRVTLDKTKRDAWGIPAAHVRCVMGEDDKMHLRAQIAALRQTVEGAGGRFEFIGSPLGLEEFGKGAYPDADPFSRFVFRKWFGKTMIMGAAIHETGGARMGDNPADSVLNAHNQSWDVPNLYVTDASAFVSSGVTGTTLTLMALTVRACRHLAQTLRAA
ncbi:oxidoreductase protein (plasmid) [Ketogulonicigenium robustum]|uniref:Oxidoreductase protein n=1 Tax=Ketogulonicigenium robustum TaxID=92947 RepID=A0A1W6P3D7_9RHOB|nr:GMC family oxidoreductase [Ketogulonicigenium robustum]ARO15939.1 oxidoreductase protein [Ketogulonicigenium robustum]